jgi:hypothetical protein
MSRYFDVSVIIPNAHDHQALLKIVRAVCGQTTKPKEILIVDSSVNGISCPAECLALCKENSIKFFYEHRDHAFPGDARNIGLGMANGRFIAFIDVETFPRSNWLEVSIDLIERNFADGVLGATFFVAKTSFERLVRDGFYGFLPRNTLPGAVFKREVFDKAGQFIGWVRAGEDTEWMLRLEVLKVPTVVSKSPLLDYFGLVNLDLKKLLKKWIRNYSSSRELPHFFPQKLLIKIVLYPLLVLIAFNWNYLIADWRIDSSFYIGHVTKITATIPLLAYFFLRGFLLPLHRGVGFWQLLPIRFVIITLICLLADGVKVLVFIIPKRILFVLTKIIDR